MDFEIESDSAPNQLSVCVSRLIIAGWTARDRAANDRHIEELRGLGVPPPKSTPMFYSISASRLTQAVEIEVPGHSSSGEVEFILLRHDGKLYVGVGSDHTDREVEKYGVTMSKQVCDKPVAATLWLYDDLCDHWDQLILQSCISDGESRSVYQQGRVIEMLDPSTLLTRYESVEGEFKDDSLMFGGTLPTRNGIRYSSVFTFGLIDPVLNRVIEHSYAVKELPCHG